MVPGWVVPAARSPNYRVSLPTKIVEYCALGVPVITTPLPLASDLVRSDDVGFEVPWDDPSAVVDTIAKLRADPELRRQLGANGHQVALREHDWKHLSTDFVRVMDAIATQVRDAHLATATQSHVSRLKTAKRCLKADLTLFLPS